MTAFRQDITALRRSQEELHQRLDRVDADIAEMNRKLDAVLAAIVPSNPPTA